MSAGPSQITRFWQPGGGPIELDGSGFLIPPGRWSGDDPNHGLVRLRDLDARPCLGLLGEPGMGKTTALESEVEATRTAGAAVLHIDLGEVGDASDFVRTFFEDSLWDSFHAGQALHCYLDAFDELSFSLQNAAQILVRELRRLTGRERLYLRIATRPGTWSRHLEEGLGKLWPGEVAVYSLAPLTRGDAATIANSMGVDALGPFFEEVERSGVAVLATRPLTLRLLAGLYRRDGRRPLRRGDLFESGCLALCSEQNASRRAAGRIGRLSDEQRLAVASRLAALNVLSGRLGFWLGAEPDRPSPNWLTLSELAGGTETANGADFEVDADGVREVLTDTGLFSGRGAERLTLTHRAYGEFLSARYLLEHGLPETQLRSLLLHPGGGDRIVPQLQQVAGWLAMRLSDVLAMLEAGDPAVLLAAEREDADEDARRRGVAALLRAAEGGLLDEAGLNPDEYVKLAHAGLADQLRPVVSDKGRSGMARHMAIDMARAGRVVSLSDALMDLAKDPSEALPFREAAVRAVVAIGDGTTRARFREVLAGDLSGDAYDELRGCSLQALWPSHISASEVFGLMTLPRSPNSIGTYNEFIASNFPTRLADDDLPAALNWAATLGREYHLQRDFAEMIDRLLLRAWSRLEAAGVIETLAEAV